MRRTTALITGLVLIGGLVACGEDSGGSAEEDFCTALSELQGEVGEFESMRASGASVDELGVQATAVAASAKNVSADAQRLDDPAATDAMNEATAELTAALTAVSEATLPPEQEAEAIEAAVDEFAASAEQVSTQVGCTAE
jgi:hypothetical protein